MEDLNFENINDFDEYDVDEVENEFEDDSGSDNDSESESSTERINPDTLFSDGSDDNSESVGNEDIQDTENFTDDSKSGDSSADFYSSIASALKADGVLEYLDDDMVSAITDADTFKEAMAIETRSKFNAAQRDLYDALGYGGDVQGMKALQDTIYYLNSIDTSVLSMDGDKQVEDERRRLIYNDYILRGFSEDKAAREVEKSFNAGTDIEDALEALDSQKQYYSQAYTNKINADRQQAQHARQQEQLRYQNAINATMNIEEPFDGVKLDKRTRSKIVDNTYIPSYEDNTGQRYSAVEAYALMYPDDFKRNVGTIFTLTDGFRNLNKLAGKMSKKEKNNNIRNLEKVLKNQTSYGGSPRYVSNGYGDAPVNNSRFTLDI